MNISWYWLILQGHKVVGGLWNTSGLKWADFIPAEEITTFLKDNVSSILKIEYELLYLHDDIIKMCIHIKKHLIKICSIQNIVLYSYTYCQRMFLIVDISANSLWYACLDCYWQKLEFTTSDGSQPTTPTTAMPMIKVEESLNNLLADNKSNEDIFDWIEVCVF